MSRRTLILISLLLLAVARKAGAQELEPRAYSASPVGTSFFSVGVGESNGSVLFDPSLPITDASAKIVSVTAGYARAVRIGHLQGLVTATVPYAKGTVEGMVYEQSHQVHRTGLCDVRVKLSLNLVGTRAMNREQFAKAPRRTIMGVSLTVQAPTGQYDRTKLINLGTNRWSFKPEIGVSVPVGHWYFEGYAGVWFFADNGQAYPGDATREQEPLTSLQAHVSYVFKSRVWLAFDSTWYGGGAVTVDSGPPSEAQSNSRIGATLSLPVTKDQSLKLAASRGATTRTGTDFDTYLVAWQLRWF